MSAHINGDNGKLVVGGEPVAGITDWSLHVERDYIDASQFYSGEKTFVRASQQVTGSFDLALDDDNPLSGAMSSHDPVSVFLYVDATLPWYQSWFYRLFARWKPWPTMLLYGGRAYLDGESHRETGGMAETTIDAHFVGPVTYHFYETPVWRLKRNARAMVTAAVKWVDARQPRKPEPEPAEKTIVSHYWCDSCGDNHEVYDDGTDEMGNRFDGNS